MLDDHITSAAVVKYANKIGGIETVSPEHVDATSIQYTTIELYAIAMPDIAMEKYQVAAAVIVTALLLHWTNYLGFRSMGTNLGLNEVKAPQILHEHTEYLKKKALITVVPGVHVALGFAHANSVLLEGPAGLVVVDTTESVQSAREVLAAFRNVSSKPIVAIILTHHHQDHTFGIQAFLEDAGPDVQIWAHESHYTSFLKETTVHAMLKRRAMRQFGTYLADRGHVNSGIGYRLLFDENFQTFPVKPTHTFPGDEVHLSIAGIDITLIHIPGESSDQIAVWVPSLKVLLPSDDVYKAFPNLYAIRGTESRNVLTWVKSLDRMRSLGAEHMLPLHTHPLEGKELIHEILTDYRDAIQFVHDQTVRYINKGLHPDQIVNKVHLPQRLAQKPYLQELYGTVRWSVRGIFNQYLGWFSGSAQDLEPLSLEQKSPRIIELAGGKNYMLKAGQSAIESKDFQWALELATYILAVDSSNSKAKDIKYTALKELAALQTSANSRNYYLTTILEDERLVETVIPEEVRKQQVRIIPMDMLMKNIVTRMKADECADTLISGIFHFTDLQESFSLQLRNGIMELTIGEIETFDFKLTTQSQIHREIASKERSFLWSYLLNRITIEGSFWQLKAFFECIDQSLD